MDVKLKKRIAKKAPIRVQRVWSTDIVPAATERKKQSYVKQPTPET
jgi:hypothetical protein